MGGYIGARAGSLSTTTVANVQDVTATDTTPEVTIINNTHEDTDGGREGKVIFKGQQSGGEESTLAEIQGSHDGTSDDEKGDLIFKTNDGSDGASPTERMRIDSDGKIFLGNTDTHQYDAYGDNVKLQLESAGTAPYAGFGMLQNSNDADAAPLIFGKSRGTSIGSTTIVQDGDLLGRIEFQGMDGADLETGASIFGVVDGTPGSNDMPGRLVFNTTADGANSATERMRIDSSGNLLVGKTTTSFSTAGSGILATGEGQFVRDGGHPISINRKTNDGNLIYFAKDGSTVGNIVTVGGDMVVGTGDVGFRFDDGSDVVTPWNTSTNSARDNAIDLGHSTARFDDIYATNGTIQTSDANEKQNIASLTSAEITAATAISKLFKTFKWNDSVAAKGDNARTHTGVIAQQVESAMSDAGLDAGNYAFFISTTWWETQTEVAAVEADEENGIEAADAYTRTDTYDTADEAPEGATERNRKGIRYPELLSFIGAATEQRLTSIEARLTALEG